MMHALANPPLGRRGQSMDLSSHGSTHCPPTPHADVPPRVGQRRKEYCWLTGGKVLIKALFAVFAISTLFVAVPSFAANGEQIFRSNDCIVCHDATRDQVAEGLGPSLKMIAAAYKGKEDALIRFLKGEGKPRLYPEEYPIMEGQLDSIRGLSDDGRKALATFLLSH
jgi:cytochrome c